MQVVGPKLFGGSAWARRLGARVGAGCRIYFSHFGDQPLGTEPFLITIGDRVTVTSGVKLITHDGSTWLLREADGTRYQRYASITIGDDVFIGVDTIVLPGVTIGSNVVIGAGSVVTHDVPSNSVAVGNPVRVVKSFDAFREKMTNVAVLDDARFQGMESKERIMAMIASHAAPS